MKLSGNPPTDAIQPLADHDENTTQRTKKTPTETASSMLSLIAGQACINPTATRGVRVYLRYIDEKLEPVMRGFGHVSDTGSSSSNHGSENQQRNTLDFACNLMHTLKSMPSNRTSIEDIVDEFLQTTGKATVSHNQRTRLAIYQAVFHTIARVTLLYSPIVSDGPPGFTFTGNGNRPQHVDLAYASRPVHALLRYTGALQTQLFRPFASSNQATAVSSAENIIDTANVAFSALCTLGHLSVLPVDSLDQHLALDPNLHRLYMFRFPSVLMCMHADDGDTLLTHLISCSDTSDDGHNNMRQTAAVERLKKLTKEALMTYFLLFGQNKSSKKHYRKKRLMVMCDEHSDPLLEEFTSARIACEFHSPTFARIVPVHQRMVSEIEFPFFGTRLTELSEHVQRHRPSRLKDLYRDRRDQDKFWTFWAIITFGTTAIIIGVIQMLLTAVQVAFAYEQWKSSPG